MQTQLTPRALNHIGAGKLERIGATATRPKLEHIGSRKLDHIGARDARTGWRQERKDLIGAKQQLY